MTSGDSAIYNYIECWHDRGEVLRDTREYWAGLLRILGIAEPDMMLCVEEPVVCGGKDMVVVHMEDTRTLIAQWPVGTDLGMQSDGIELSPYQLVLRAVAHLQGKRRPRWLVLCNFGALHIYDMQHTHDAPIIITLDQLPQEIQRLGVLVATDNAQQCTARQTVLHAVRLIRALHDTMVQSLVDDTPLDAINLLCMQLVCCLYVDDVAGGNIRTYLRSLPPEELPVALHDLLVVMGTREEDRSRELDSWLAAIPYIGIALLRDVVMPPLTGQVVAVLHQICSADIAWSAAGTTILGAAVECIIDPAIRRGGGMYYTSVDNIHRLIDPMIIAPLAEELDVIATTVLDPGKRYQMLRAYRMQLAAVVVLDPACGTASILCEVYLSLRRLEDRAIDMCRDIEGIVVDPVMVTIDQMHGIEIDGLAAMVAEATMWFAQWQSAGATTLLHRDCQRQLGDQYSNIVRGNALRMDWADVVPMDTLRYIVGNPPYVGHQRRDVEQTADMRIACAGVTKYGKLDYAAAWYCKAADYMCGTGICTAYISAQTMVCGESVGILWAYMAYKQVQIQYAHRCVAWTGISGDTAAVQCVIIGMTCDMPSTGARLYSDYCSRQAEHINGYLLAAPDMFLGSRGQPLMPGIPRLTKGSQPTDGGHLLLTPAQRDDIVSQYPEAMGLIRRFVGARELIEGINRYCLWLQDVASTVYSGIPAIMERLDKVADMRRHSTTPAVHRCADTPMLFAQRRQPSGQYLAIPRHTTDRRKYIPIGVLDSDVICGDANLILEDWTPYILGVLLSSVHMAWVRIVCGRLGNKYRYSAMVYNNYPWPTPTPEQRTRIAQTANGILYARACYPGWSLGQLYDVATMPAQLRRAHQRNDDAVMQAYNFDGGNPDDHVAALIRMYVQRLDNMQ